MRWSAALAGLTLCTLVAGALTGPAASAAAGDVTDLRNATGPAAPPSPGAPGLGDQLYPTLGNGGYQVLRYDLDLRYATATPGQQLDGTVTMAAVATQALSSFHLDFAGDSVGGVTVNGGPATFARDGEELVVTPSAPLLRGPFTVRVSHFTSTPTAPDPAALLGAVFIRTADGTVWAGQPGGIHRIFPCNDHPADKATFSFSIDVPSGTTAVANGMLVRKSTAGGRTVWHYEQPEPMATELAQVAVGALTVTPRGRTSGVTVRDVTPTRLTAALAPKLASVTDHLAWMERKVGDYPFTSYGSLVADADLGFALETQTLSLYDADLFERYDPPRSPEPVMVHELAHQWFGDSVAPTRWSDIWQNEGHATWYQFTYAAERGLLEQDTGIADLTALMRTIYQLGDRWRAVLGPVGAPRSGDPADLFNINVYYGGALVLYALRQKIGDAAFQRVERTWVERYRGRSASTADFIALASTVTGQNLRPFLTEWLYGTRTPPMPGHADWTVLPVEPATTADRAASPASGPVNVPMNGLKPFIRH